MATVAKVEPAVTVSDALDDDDHTRAVIADLLGVGREVMHPWLGVATPTSHRVVL